MLKACVTSEFDLSGKDAVASCVAAAASVQFHRFAARVRKQPVVQLLRHKNTSVVKSHIEIIFLFHCRCHYYKCLMV